MHLNLQILTFVFFQLILSSRAQSDDTSISSTQLANEYKAKATLFIDPIDPDKWAKLSDVQKKDEESLSPIAGQLASRQDSREIILKLLNEYNGHEGLARDLLWSAVAARRPYNKSDLPYLKKLFLLSFDFKQTKSNMPLRDPGFLLTPERIRFKLAVYISFLNDPSLPDRTIVNESLFETDSRAWVEKQIP